MNRDIDQEEIQYHKQVIENLSNIIDRYSVRENNELHTAFFDVKQSHALLMLQKEKQLELTKDKKPEEDKVNQLIEDYQRRVKTCDELLKDPKNSEETIMRLKIKRGCFNTFLHEINI